MDTHIQMTMLWKLFLILLWRGLSTLKSNWLMNGLLTTSRISGIFCLASVLDHFLLFFDTSWDSMRILLPSFEDDGSLPVWGFVDLVLSLQLPSEDLIHCLWEMKIDRFDLQHFLKRYAFVGQISSFQLPSQILF